jgi:uncharacterized RDD family membrane protein YckC
MKRSFLFFVFLGGCLLYAWSGNRVFSQLVELEKSTSRPQTIHLKEVVQMGGDIVIASNEVAHRCVVINGHVKIQGRVEGDVVVIMGSAEINGSVGRDVVSVLSSTRFGRQAIVGQSVISVLNSTEFDPQSRVHGNRLQFPPGFNNLDFTWLRDWVSDGLFMARPLPPNLTWGWIVVGLFFALYFALALVFPKPVRTCVAVLEEQPIAALFCGLGLFVLLGPLVLLLTISVVGIPLLPFLACGFMAFFWFGRVAVYQHFSREFGLQFGLKTFENPLLALLTGMVPITLLFTVPILGFLVWGLITPWGMGAVLLAMFSGLKRNGPQVSASVLCPPAYNSPTSGDSGLDSSASGFGPTGQSLDFGGLERVGFWPRLWASFLDLILLSVILIPFHWAGAFLPCFVAYHIGFWVFRGTTFGGAIAGIKLVRISGQPMDINVAVVRALGAILSFVPLFLGFFWASWSREKQAWHDRIAGTVMVRQSKGVQLI